MAPTVFVLDCAGIVNRARRRCPLVARAVCGLPEVRCVSYAMLADFMDAQTSERLAAYRKGDFPRVSAPALNLANAAP